MFFLADKPKRFGVFWFLNDITIYHEQEKLAEKTAVPAFSRPFCIGFTDLCGSGEWSVRKRGP
ncbi:MAG: hypothetical protein IJK97_09715 [Thermoguttaceae bacterium]|nr:hypothetical protein [Thermoguttaceae bacterium]